MFNNNKSILEQLDFNKMNRWCETCLSVINWCELLEDMSTHSILLRGVDGVCGVNVKQKYLRRKQKSKESYFNEKSIEIKVKSH